MPRQTDGALLSNMRSMDGLLSLRFDPVCCKCGNVLFVPDVIPDPAGAYGFTVRCPTEECKGATYTVSVLISNA